MVGAYVYMQVATSPSGASKTQPSLKVELIKSGMEIQGKFALAGVKFFFPDEAGNAILLHNLKVKTGTYNNKLKLKNNSFQAQDSKHCTTISTYSKALVSHMNKVGTPD